MKIDIIKVGKLRCNCYIIENKGHVLVIDPGNSTVVNKIANRIVDGVIITHHHDDHDGGVSSIIDKYNTKMYDINNLDEGKNKIGLFEFNVIYNPGHKEDAISIYFDKEKIMFVGDFIFRNSIGRCDLDGGNIHDMFESINKIKKYPKDIVIYPGHGEDTTLGYEINNNPYFRDYL